MYIKVHKSTLNYTTHTYNTDDHICYKILNQNFGDSYVRTHEKSMKLGPKQQLCSETER